MILRGPQARPDARDRSAGLLPSQSEKVFGSRKCRLARCGKRGTGVPMISRYFSAPEPLEARIAPATLDLSNGYLTYTAGSGVANALTISISGPNYVFQDTGETISLTAGTVAAGFTGDGTHEVIGPSAAPTSLTIMLGDQDDTLTLLGLVTQSTSVYDGDGNDSVTVGGALNPSGSLLVM